MRVKGRSIRRINKSVSSHCTIKPPGGAWMRKLIVSIALLLMYLLFACGQQDKIDEASIKMEINRVMAESERAWNEGDIEKYMESYSKTDSIRFAGNGNVSYGWQTVLQRYKNGYPDKAAMGILTFSDVDIDVVSKDAAVVFGRWKLQKDKDSPSGLYTLLFRKTEAGWRIVHDHSSSAEKKKQESTIEAQNKE